jgi:hypothetical protein
MIRENVIELMASDVDILADRGITEEQVIEQLNHFRKGFPVLDIVKPATTGDGIQLLEEQELYEYQLLYDGERVRKRIVKFVPASGAATRMFKSLFEYLETRNLNQDAEEVLQKLNTFAFYNQLNEILSGEGINPEEAYRPEISLKIIDRILNRNGLNYGNLPKGLIKFHFYNDKARTAFEEHLVEGALYASGEDDQVNIHFTVSPEHKAEFMRLLETVRDELENRFQVNFDVEFSEQKPSTDTIAADSNNEPFRDKDGNILFRPGGHGALLDNLNEIDADIIFIKNIDNVVPDRLKPATILYKKALAGILIKLQNEIFDYLDVLDLPGAAVIPDIVTFIEKNLGYRFPSGFDNLSDPEKEDYLKSILNRPLRVCGMVRNEGEPGGGPFWVRAGNGSLSLQILESSQFNFSIPEHQYAFRASTHFNPVDLVCATKNNAGEPFDLFHFRDTDTGFISVKSKDGKELKALELPGLWNGAMAFWNTVFVEVPVETFNPVKTINDLLRPQHLG